MPTLAGFGLLSIAIQQILNLAVKLKSHQTPSAQTDETVVYPKTGKSYRLKAELSADGKTFELHGYVGILLIGRAEPL